MKSKIVKIEQDLENERVHVIEKKVKMKTEETVQDIEKKLSASK